MGERIPQRLDVAVAPRQHDRAREVVVGVADRRGVGEIGFRHDQQRCHAGIPRRDQRAIGESGLRGRLGGRDDDAKLVGIGHEHPFHRIGVIGTASQHMGPIGHPHDARHVIGTGAAADARNPVADDHRTPAQSTGLHGEQALGGGGVAGGAIPAGGGPGIAGVPGSCG